MSFKSNLKQRKAICIWRSKRRTGRPFTVETGKKKKKEHTGDYGAEGMCLGMCFGTALGAAFGNNIAIGLPLGMLFGLAIGSSIKKEEQNNDEKE